MCGTCSATLTDEQDIIAANERRNNGNICKMGRAGVSKELPIRVGYWNLLFLADGK